MLILLKLFQIKNIKKMKKEMKKVKVKIYLVTLVYADCFEESFYRSFRDDEHAYKFCRRLYVETKDCIDCFFEFVKKVDL